MAKLDDALLNRLGAYVDGELSAVEAAEIEELIDQDAEIAQVVEGLEASTCSIRDDFLGQIEKEPIPEEWLKLIADGGRPPLSAERFPARWPMIAGVALCGVVLALCALTYVNLIEIHELRNQLATINDQSVVPSEAPYQQAAGRIAQSVAIAGSYDESGNLSREAQTNDLSHRLALATANLEVSGDRVELSTGAMTIALQQIEALRAALTKASDPIQLITAEHHLLDRQEDGTLPVIDQLALETILSEIWVQPLTVPNLEQEGFAFKGGRLVAINDQPSAHLVYRNADGQALGLWMRPRGESWIDPTRDHEGDLALVTWSDTSTSYLLVGALQRSYLESIAVRIRP
ncbi:MAG: hypothetical protein ACR2RF_29820 [Geminicoccaceae bacterium]